jgi:hemoglobin
MVQMSHPTLYEWAGGLEALNRLTETFYDKVLRDPVVGPVFRTMSPDHPAHVAAFIGEVFGGPKTYSEKHGGHREMVMHHLGKHLTEDQRRRWINLLVDAADAVGLPDDPEFRSAFMAYVEWGSRLAKMNSNLGETCDPATEPMPAWGWGVPGGPYQPPSGG